MKMNILFTVSILFSLFLVSLGAKASPSSLLRSGNSEILQQMNENIEKVGLFVEGFTHESIFRTKKTISVGLGSANILELSLSDLKEGKAQGITLLAAPSDVIVGSEAIVKEGVDILAGLVENGSILFSQVDSSSPLCKNFIFNGVTTENSPYIYNGDCVGPITKTESLIDESKAVTIKVQSKSDEEVYNNFFVFRGFYFKDVDQVENCQPLGLMTPNPEADVLINFDKDASTQAALVVCKYGKGAAILSGVHIDQNKSFIDAVVKSLPEEKREHLSKVSEQLTSVSKYLNTLLGFLLTLTITATE